MHRPFSQIQQTLVQLKQVIAAEMRFISDALFALHSPYSNLLHSHPSNSSPNSVPCVFAVRWFGVFGLQFFINVSVALFSGVIDFSLTV